MTRGNTLACYWKTSRGTLSVLELKIQGVFGKGSLFPWMTLCPANHVSTPSLSGKTMCNAGGIIPHVFLPFKRMDALWKSFISRLTERHVERASISPISGTVLEMKSHLQRPNSIYSFNLGGGRRCREAHAAVLLAIDQWFSRGETGNPFKVASASPKTSLVPGL